MKKSTIWIIVVVVLLGASVWYSKTASEKNNVGVVLEDHIKGNPDAVVELVEYSDFQCPACRQAAPFVADIVDRFENDLRFEYRHFPLIAIHPNALTAAKASEAAAVQGKFFEFHDRLFEEQPNWSNSTNPQRIFVGYAEELGLDVDTFSRHMRASLIDDEVRRDMAQGMELGVPGTPTFFLNGRAVSFSSFDELVQQIEAAIGSDSGDESATPESDIRFGI